MAQTFLLPGWRNLSSEQKKLIEEWIKTILLAKKSGANILKLLGHGQASTDFAASLEEILNQSDDFEIIDSDQTGDIQNLNDVVSIINTSCEAVCANKPNYDQCMQKCQNPGG